MPEKRDWTREELQRDYVDIMTAVTLPVEIKMEGSTRIFDFNQAEAILKKANIISLSDCDCRKKVLACDGPLDVCLSIDKEAEIMISKGEGRKVTLDEALSALKQSHDAGLVHMSYIDKGETEPFIICSCCACCCHSLAGLMRFDLPELVVESDHVALQNEDACIQCGVCVDRCHFQARNMENGSLSFKPSKCFGCGVCVSTCPVEAISMVNRSDIESRKD
jgi:NAD-dependent dihydropyrimidine dehydrogenase PreA subunit